MKIQDVFGKMPVLETERLILRKMNAGDAADMFEYSSNREVTRYLSYDHTSVAEAQKYIQNKVDKYALGECMLWGIVWKEDHKYIGACGFTHWDIDHQVAEIAYTLNQRYWGRGIASELVQLLLQFGFERMKLNRIEARCWSENEKSEKVMVRNQMKFEGVMREQFYLKGNYRDVKMYSILKKEYKRNLSVKQ